MMTGQDHYQQLLSCVFVYLPRLIDRYVHDNVDEHLRFPNPDLTYSGGIKIVDLLKPLNAN